MATLRMVGVGACTYQVGNTVVKVPRHDEELEITHENLKAARAEAECYRILGSHNRIARCLYNSPTDDFLVLELYQNGTLCDYWSKSDHHLRLKWARQMVEAICYIHSRGVRHSDLRIEQWLLDSCLDIRLSDFNSAGHDGDPTLGIKSRKAQGHECATHFLPRDPSVDNSVRSDVFALGSSLYELEVGTSPHAGLEGERITELFAEAQYPNTAGLELGRIITNCWKQNYESADQILLEINDAFPSA